MDTILNFPWNAIDPANMDLPDLSEDVLIAWDSSTDVHRSTYRGAVYLARDEDKNLAWFDSVSNDLLYRLTDEDAPTHWSLFPDAPQPIE
ncbi:hypothetical protein Q9L42_021385 (plasmid) [Methylomarinum sp. Ch1-1]|uniref:DUF551 domain-containing protein n=1 Tax=Methylomarinum roseum TaxID=3067653 RepID=A0AAU7P123_9GAMM|nr:hypothetical protein [Methylomarinum sp. Ch1-1]MDP4523220.1 hypothetical protein [Methylomarinum sp. Ch1-1]